MKKLLIVLGSIFLGLFVLAGIGIAILAWRGNALDKESKAYVDAAVPAIVSSWSEQELMNRASPELRQATKPADMDRMFAWFRTLGRLQQYEGSQGQAVMSVTSQTGKLVSGHYVAKAMFERGAASIEIGVIKHGGEWQIAKFRVDSAALVPLQQH